MLLNGLQSRTVAIRVHHPVVHHPWQWLLKITRKCHL